MQDSPGALKLAHATNYKIIHNTFQINYLKAVSVKFTTYFVQLWSYAGMYFILGTKLLYFQIFYKRIAYSGAGIKNMFKSDRMLLWCEMKDKTLYG